LEALTGEGIIISKVRLNKIYNNMKNLKEYLKPVLVAAAIAFIFTACENPKPKDPSEGTENISNEQGEDYGAKGDDRHEPSRPGESTTGGTTGENDRSNDTTKNRNR
jgi:hypothetical protein